MKIIVIGHTGTIGGPVAAALAARGHHVTGVSRHGDPAVDLEDAHSLERLFDRVTDVDAVVCCAGDGAFKPLAELTDADLAYSIRSKLMGQVNLARVALHRLRDGGSITLTSGVLAQVGMPGAAAFSMINAGVEGFVRSAQLDLRRDLRLNAVSPPWIKETMAKLGMDPTPGMAAATAANAYVAAVESTARGEILPCTRFA